MFTWHHVTGSGAEGVCSIVFPFRRLKSFESPEVADPRSTPRLVTNALSLIPLTHTHTLVRLHLTSVAKSDTRAKREVFSRRCRFDVVTKVLFPLQRPQTRLLLFKIAPIRLLSLFCCSALFFPLFSPSSSGGESSLTGNLWFTFYFTLLMILYRTWLHAGLAQLS